jgi:hypothetical protein
VWEAALSARLRGQPLPGLAPEPSRLQQLVEIFGLSPYERDVVAVLWTTACAPQWRGEVAGRDVFPGHVTVAGVAHTFGHAACARLSSESPLLLWRIVAEHPFVEGSAALSLDPQLLAWLEGRHDLDRALVGRARLLHARFELPSWRLDARAGELGAGLRDGDHWRVRLLGGDLAAAESYAAALANRLGLLALRVQAEAGSSDETHERAVRVYRQAYLDRCAPCWEARESGLSCLDELPPFPLQFLLGGEAPVATESIRDVDVVLPELDAGERRTLWLRCVPAAASWPAAALEDLALRFEASPGDILRAAGRRPRNAGEAAACVRETWVDDLGGLAQSLACPFAWDDLVVPAPVRERLEEITFEARERARLWAQPEAARLYPQGRGLVALLAGPPGTGKTMSAQVIAADLGLELRRVDISRILSKWVGETAQHLQRVLSSAASRRSVLLFDEADALFGKRIESDTRSTTAQDHFVNMDLGHLMIALESYTGVVLLATNLRANIDAAFVRRIRHSVELPMPDGAAREAIWTRTVAALCGSPLPAPIREAVRRVARVESSGAQIKNAALSAAFAARRARQPPDADLFGRMLARELAKDGAGMSAREMAATLEAVS